LIKDKKESNTTESLTVYKRKEKEKKTHSPPTTKLVILAIVQLILDYYKTYWL